MSKLHLGLAFLWTILASLAITLAVGETPTFGQEKDVPKKTAPQERKAKEFRGRLPAYYGKVVDKKQREAIYAIQKEYFTQIRDLRAQLDALTEERNERISAVLTPEQLKEVEDFKAAAAAKRKKSSKTTPKKPRKPQPQQPSKAVPAK